MVDVTFTMATSMKVNGFEAKDMVKAKLSYSQENDMLACGKLIGAMVKEPYGGRMAQCTSAISYMIRNMEKDSFSFQMVLLIMNCGKMVSKKNANV